MKRIISMILAISIACSMVVFVQAKIETDEDTIVYMSFDNELPEGVNANGNFDYTEGISGNAGLFDGNETYLQLPENITEGVTDFTISMWVRFDKIKPDTWQRVYDFGTEEGKSMYFGMWQYLKSNNVRTAIDGEASSAYNVFAEGEWVHYAIVQSGEKRTLYLNGYKVSDTDANNSAAALGATHNYIGKWNKNTEPTEYFNGAIDDFLFTKKAYKPEEVAAVAFEHMNDEKKVESLSKMVYLNLNEKANGFDYLSFNDGYSRVEWSSSRPDVLTVDGFQTDKLDDMTEATITATMISGEVSNQIDYTYVILENEYGELEITVDTAEKIAIRNIRRTKATKVDTTKFYRIKKKGEKKYLASDSEGNLITTSKSWDEGTVWRFAQSPKENIYAIFSVNSGKCLNVADWNKEKGAKVILNKGGKGANEIWYVVQNEKGLGILSYFSEFFLTDELTLGGLDNLTEWELVETTNRNIQYGKKVTNEKSIYTQINTDKYYALKAGDKYLTDISFVAFADGIHGDNEKWKIEWVDEYNYTITSKATGKNLNVRDESVEAGAEVIVYQPVNADNDKWRFIKSGSGYKIVGKANKNYMAAENDKLIMSENHMTWTLVETDELVPVKETEEPADNGESWAMALITDYVPEINEVIDEDTGFIHPGIAITKAEIERFQKHIRAGDEPWISEFEMLAADEYSKENPRIFSGDGGGDTTKLTSEWRLKNMRYDATTATDQALMYLITGNEKYRENTMKIIRAWYKLRDCYTSLGSDWIDHGVIAYKMTVAAELMKYSSCENEDLVWTEEDNEMFIGMLDATNDKYDRYWLWMNQHNICNQGTMASAIFRNDLEAYKTAVVRTSTNPEGGGSKYTMTGSGGAITQVFRIVDYDAWNGDKIEPTFVHAEMGRDQGHAYGNVSALATCAMMTYLQGTKVDPETGEMTDAENGVNMFEFADHRLLKGASYIARYNLGYNVVHPSINVGDIYVDINDTNRGHYYTICGILYNYYKYYAKADMNQEDLWYLSQMHIRNFPEPLYTDNIGIADMLYATDEAAYERDDAVDKRSDATAALLQPEKYTAVLQGEVVTKETEDSIYLNVIPEDGRAQFAYANGYYPPSERNTVRLRVRTRSQVTVTLQNEHLVYAPYCYGVIPNTHGRWETVEFKVQSEGNMRQRLYFFTFDTNNAFDIDWVKFGE